MDIPNEGFYLLPKKRAETGRLINGGLRLNSLGCKQKCKNTNTVQKRNTVLVAVLRLPVTSQRAAVRIKAYIGDIRVHYSGAFAKMNASFFSFLPAQREKSCVTRLYFLPQNKKINTDETAAPHSTLLSLFLLLQAPVVVKIIDRLFAV